MRRSMTLTLFVAACTLTAFAQTLSLRPGQYETTVEMDMPGGMKFPPQKDSDCITADDLKDFSKTVADPEFEKTCKVSDYKVVGNKLTFRSDCKEDDVQATGIVEITFGTESYTGVMTTKDNKGRVMTIKMTGKRIGECAKQALERPDATARLPRPR